jgi:DNA polymerase-1
MSRSSGTRSTCYLIDGSAYVYRAYFALPQLFNSQGMATNAIYGFATTLLKILREHRPSCLAVVFDERGPTTRHEEFAQYKAHRPEMPQGMQAQIPYIHRLVEAFGLPAIRQAGYEADDLIGTLARKAEAAGFDVVIVTGDKDMFQLLSPHVRIFDPVKDKWFGEAECRERFGVEPSRVVEIMGLMGDAIDNIPGIKGIGEKTATKLIVQFGTIEALLDRIHEVPGAKTQALLKEQAEQARLSRRLAMIHLDVPIEFDPARFTVGTPNPGPLVALFRELEFHTLIKAVQPEGEEPALVTKIDVLSDGAALERFAGQARNAEFIGIYPVMAVGEGVEVELDALALSAGGDRAAYLPKPSEQGWPVLKTSLGASLSGLKGVKAAHDVKPLLVCCARAALDLEAPWFDTMIASYLLNPNRRTHSLESVAMDVLGYRVGIVRSRPPAEAASEGPTDLFDVRPPAPDQARMARAGEAAAVIARLAPILKGRLEEQGSLRLFNEVEMPLVPVLADIERQGFALDVAALENLSKELERELARMMESITRLAGQEFNINSPRQLASVLFETLKLKPIRKTKTGYSTDEETLTQLATRHALPAEILNYRGLSKLKSTYVDALPLLVSRETGRLHTSLNQTVAATGRLSSTEPNLQNIPVKGDYGLRIREAFIAPPGYSLLCADYSQIEPRILAHLSRDERLVRVFEQAEDIHSATAVEIFGKPAAEITRDMRRVAKTVVFGILYGISPFGLASTLGISQQEAKKYIEAYFERYGGVKTFIEKTIEEARRLGYTTTILGRRRPIPELASADPIQRNLGERMAVNSPIQGSAADLIKVAMIQVHRRLQETFPRTKMILQVHDELIFEVPMPELEQVKQLVKAEMEGVGRRLGLSVPLKVELGVGPNWRAAHP